MSSTLTRNLAEVSRCTAILVEAVADLKRERAVKRLEKEVAKWFRWQGRVLISAFPKMKQYFTESAASDFDDVFDRAIKVTVLNGEEIFEAGLTRGITQGFEYMADEIGMAQAFELDHPAAVKWSQKNAAVHVTEVNGTTKETIRGIVTTGIDKGLGYDTVARRITKRFSEFAIGKPQLHIESRAHLVAVTENAMAYENGGRMLVDEIQATGIDMEKSWHTVGDDRVSAGCRDNADAGWIPAGDGFPSGEQNPPRFPGCRCNTHYRVSRAGE